VSAVTPALLEANHPAYVQADISDEEWRVVVYPDGSHYVIPDPVTLIYRKGGSTHRVIDKNGVVHCYAAPETGKSVIQWKAREGKPAVRF
jgi:hypothetical protein